MRVLLTGATGFVGSQVARQLVGEGHEVLALVRPAGSKRERLSDIAARMTFWLGDFRAPDGYPDVLAADPVDVCIHLAWCVEPGSYLTDPENVDLARATWRFAERLAQVGCRRFVGVGTCFEYDTSAGTLGEDVPIAPAFLYSAAKAGTYFMLKNLGSNTMSMAWARLFYLYGPGEDRRRLVPSIVCALLEGGEARCTHGRQVRDFLHVEDVASALCAIARDSVEGAINIGSGVPVTVAEIVERIGEIIGRPYLIKLGALPQSPGDPPFICADNRKLVNATLWRPRFSLEEGLRHTVEWWRRRKDRERTGDI